MMMIEFEKTNGSFCLKVDFHSPVFKQSVFCGQNGSLTLVVCIIYIKTFKTKKSPNHDSNSFKFPYIQDNLPQFLISEYPRAKLPAWSQSCFQFILVKLPFFKNS
jgi:hypothetical protein